MSGIRRLPGIASFLVAWRPCRGGRTAASFLRPQVPHPHRLPLRARNLARPFDEDIGRDADERLDVVRDVCSELGKRLVGDAGLCLDLDADVIEPAPALDD